MDLNFERALPFDSFCRDLCPERIRILSSPASCYPTVTERRPKGDPNLTQT